MRPPALVSTALSLPRLAFEMWSTNSEKFVYCFFFNDTATTEIYTLSLPDALPICGSWARGCRRTRTRRRSCSSASSARSEEHTSEIQSLAYLVCRLLLEKKTERAQATSISAPVTTTLSDKLRAA